MSTNVVFPAAILAILVAAVALSLTPVATLWPGEDLLSEVSLVCAIVFWAYSEVVLFRSARFALRARPLRWVAYIILGLIPLAGFMLFILDSSSATLGFVRANPEWAALSVGGLALVSQGVRRIAAKSRADGRHQAN